VKDSFRLTNRGPAVIGHIEAGCIHVGDVFEELAPPGRRGTILGVEGVRAVADPDAVGLLLDLDVPVGTVLLGRSSRGAT
jgi:translation elongation factor EF-Tu-like GTPase